MPDPKKYFLKLPNSGKPSPFALPEKIYSDIAWYNKHRASNRLFHAVNGIEGIAIHATAGGSTSGALSWWKNPNGGKASAHWIIPDEDEFGHGKHVLAVVYESLAAWHVRNSVSHPSMGNRKKINHWTLGVEIVNRQVPSDQFSDWQIEMTALLVRYCWAKYPNFKYVFSHALVDPTRRSDPGKNFDWDRFSDLIKSDANDPAMEGFMTKLSSEVQSIKVIPGLSKGASCCM